MPVLTRVFSSGLCIICDRIYNDTHIMLLLLSLRTFSRISFLWLVGNIFQVLTLPHDHKAQPPPQLQIDNLSWAKNSPIQAGQDVVGLGSHMSCMSCLILHFGLPVQPERMESTCMEYHHITIFNLDSSPVLTHITIGPHCSKSPRQDQDEPLALCATANTSSRVDAQLRHSSLRAERQSKSGDTIPVSWNIPH